MINKKYKVIIWGHKLHSHTHSYIHNSYYKAFKALNFETYWFDAKEDTSNFNFENCIFFTEDQAHQNIPLNKSSFYILHHCKLEKYLNHGCNYVNLCNYVNKCLKGISHNYNDSKSIEKINYYTYYDPINKGLYQPWATDLLPNEIIEQNFLSLDESKNDIYYIGSITSDNINQVRDFSNACYNNSKNFITLNNLSDEDNKNYVRKSYISPDIRCQIHLDLGYMPCRIFKNLSYGVVPATNSVWVRDFFGEKILPYSENCSDLFEINRDFIKNEYNLNSTKWLINEIKEHHTYINRVNSILKFL
jgi:hypothetical protein